MFSKDIMFCKKCGGMLNQSHTPETCSRVRKETNEQTEHPVVDTPEQQPGAKDDKKNSVILYLPGARFPQLHLYQASIVHSNRINSCITSVAIFGGAKHFSGIYVHYANLSTVNYEHKALVLTKGLFYYHLEQIATQYAFDAKTKDIFFVPNSFPNVKNGLEQKLKPAWTITKNDFKEIIKIVKENLFSGSQ